jgi:exodeoxyribonuclease V gamma subunit
VDGDPYLLRAYPDFSTLEQAGFERWLQPYRDVIACLRVESA